MGFYAPLDAGILDGPGTLGVDLGGLDVTGVPDALPLVEEIAGPETGVAPTPPVAAPVLEI